MKKINIKTVILCAIALTGFTSAASEPSQVITIPLRKSTGSMSQSPPISNPSWENKLFSALQGLRDTLQSVLKSTPDVDLDIINDLNTHYAVPVFIGSDKQ